jgi:hypothetical protein
MNTYIIDDNKLYREDDKGLYVDYVLCQADEGDATPRWTGPKIPYEMFREMTAWCEETQRRLKSEAMVLLFLDENNQWKHWYCPQETSGLSVESDDNSALYKEERKNYPDRQLGTLHHHCGVDAFQSGTDSSDEEDRDGLHFTIGNLDDDTYSLHARFCINGKSHDCPTESLVEMPKWMENVPEHARIDIMKGLLKAPTEGFKKDHFKELIEKVVDKKVYSPSAIGSYGGYGGHNGYNSYQGGHNSYQGGHKTSVTDEQAVSRLIQSESDWYPAGDKLARVWFVMNEDTETDLTDMIYALQQEADSKDAFSTQCQAFTAKLRKAINSAAWLRAEDLIGYLEEVNSIKEDDAMETAADEKEAQFTEDRMLQIEEQRAAYSENDSYWKA